MKIKNYDGFVGQHCETTTIGSLLKPLGLEFSEAMLFGLGEGLGYVFWKMKSMDFPFIGGRVKPDVLTENICRNLHLNLDIKETSSSKKAWSNIELPLSQGQVVGLKLDCYHLEYFNTKIHFAGHYAAMYGYDEKDAYLIDTDQQGGQVKTSLASLALARNERGPMSSKNKSFTITKKNDILDIKTVIRKAIKNNAAEYLNPPIKNLYYKGISKTATEIKKWFASTKDIRGDFQTTAMLMERAGTGGALFRNMYRDFLKEGSELLHDKSLQKAYLDFIEIAKLWTQVAKLFDKVGETKEKKYIDQASIILLDLAEREKASMSFLAENI